MNARGKTLTDFENFKASFIQFLEKTYPRKEGDTIYFSEYFADKIEKEWTDLFWEYRGNKYVIDDCIMNFFEFITQMWYFKKHKSAKVVDFDFTNFTIIKDVYKNKDALLFLFNALDWFYTLGYDTNGKKIDIQKINEFFSSIFQQGTIDVNYNEQVGLFEDDSKGINLFEKCLSEGGNFKIRNRIILFAVIDYSIKNNSLVNNDLKYYIRIIRNLLQATRKRTETVYDTNVSINEFGYYWILFEQLSKPNVYNSLLNLNENNNKGTKIVNEAFNNEKAKAILIFNNNNKEKQIALFKLEEFEYFGGLIHQLNPSQNIDKFGDYSQAIREIWKNNDSLIIGALIACGFEGFYTKNCKLGAMRFFGRKDRWNIVLTGNSGKDEEISKAIISLLDKYLLDDSNKSPEKKMESIIEEYLKNNSERKFQYYFLKYPKMLSRSNYFAWNGDFENRILGSESSNPLLAYHINPYVLVVSSRLDDRICEERHCYSRYGDVSGLILPNEMELICKKEGWKIILNNGTILPDDIKEKYFLDDNLILKDTKEKDRIEIAVEFCTELFKPLLEKVNN
jgi:hypothetical protein